MCHLLSKNKNLQTFYQTSKFDSPQFLSHLSQEGVTYLFEKPQAGLIEILIEPYSGSKMMYLFISVSDLEGGQKRQNIKLVTWASRSLFLSVYSQERRGKKSKVILVFSFGTSTLGHQGCRRSNPSNGFFFSSLDFTKKILI